MSDDVNHADDMDAESSVAYVGHYGGMNLGGLMASFSGPDLDAVTKRELFQAAATRLTEVVAAYAPLAGTLALDDDRLIDASTEVHRALRDLQIEHIRYTGGPIPRSRDEPVFDDSIEPEPEPVDYVPRPPLELSADVPLEITLLERPGETHRLREARAYSTGVVLTIERFLVRGTADWSTWQQRSREFMSMQRDYVDLVDLIIEGSPADPLGGSSSGRGAAVAGSSDFWIPAPILGETLRGHYRVTDAETVAFTLDASALREAQSRSRPV